MVRRWSAIGLLAPFALAPAGTFVTMSEPANNSRHTFDYRLPLGN